MAKKSKKVRKFKPIYLMVGLILTILCALTLAYIKAEETVKYNELKTVSSNDQKFKVNIPKQMMEVQSGRTTLDFEHKNSNEAQSLISHLRIESQYIGANELAQSKNDILNHLKSKNGEYYEIFKNKSSNSPLANDLKFNDFSDFNSQNVQSGLTSDFSYKYNETNVLGRLLITFNKDTMYFMIIEAVEEVWHGNVVVWQKSFESFKAE